MIERFRLITPAKLCLAFVCALGSGNARTIADIHRYFNQLHSMSVRLKPFHNQLVKLGTPEFMRQVFEQVLALHLPAVHTFSDAYRGYFKQVLLQDGTSFAVHDGLSLHFPGRFSTHSPAAVELHVTYDLEKAQPVRVSLSEDTASERDYLPEAQSLRGCLLMADAGYFSKAYIESLQNQWPLATKQDSVSRYAAGWPYYLSMANWIWMCSGQMVRCTVALCLLPLTIKTSRFVCVQIWTGTHSQPQQWANGIVCAGR
jgi:hypothetical protein